MIRVRVPATSANLGPGFDSIGLAVSLYNEFEFEEIASGTEIVQEGEVKKQDPNKNMVYMAAKKVFEASNVSMPPLRIKIKTDFPSTRGLGSSAACIIGGMVGANAMCGKLGPNEILSLATQMEGHPDNVAPCFLGGLVAAYYDGEKVTFSKTKIKDDVLFAVLYPGEKLATGKARATLPSEVSLKDASYNISHAALLMSAFQKGNFALLGEAMKDKLHQPYRKEVVSNMEEIFALFNSSGAYGSYLSGSGPSVAAIIPRDKKEEIEKVLKEYSKSNDYNYKIAEFDNNGSYVMKL